jgi:hypothetical protein
LGVAESGITVVGTAAGNSQWAAVKLLSLPTDKALCASGGKFRITVNGTNYETSVNDHTTIEGHAAALAGLIAAGEPRLVVELVGTDTVQVESDPLNTLVVTATSYDETDNGTSCTTAALNNTRVSVTTGAGDPNKAAFFTILAAVPRQTYTVKVGGLTASYTVDADGVNAKTTTVAAALAASISGGFAGYHAVRIGSTVKVISDANATPALTVEDSYGGQGMYSFTTSVKTPSQLPADFWEGYTLKISGALEGGGDDYYVTYTGDSWKETAKPGIAHYIADTTMPHKLVRNADGTFTFSKNTWLPRQSGDEDSNPMPSFVGRKINNIFFFRERLGLLAGENIIMSRAADYYNMFATTASGVLDDDPIDVSAADVKVSYLYHALPFQDSLLVFSDSAQFQLTGADVLSASTVRLEPTTRFSVGKNLPPTAAGRNVFFAVNKGANSSLREYFVTPGNTASSDALDITSHVPAYIPKNIRTLESSSLTDCMVAVSNEDGNEAYVYKFLWNGETKVQSSWGKWVFDADASVLAMGFDEATLSMVVLRSDGTYLEQVDLQNSRVETGMDRSVYLDRRLTLTGVYSAETGRTTWTLPFADTGTWQVVKAGGWTTSAGTVLPVTKDSTTTVSAYGNYSASPCFVGKPYTMRYRFSEFFLKDGEKTALLTGRLQLRTLTMGFSKTGYFRLEVTPKLRDTYSYPYTATLLGDIQASWDTSPLMTGRHRFPTVGSSALLQLDLVNDTPLPCFFHGAEWEALYVQRAKRL